MKEKISLEFARDIGLIPKPDMYNRHYWGNFCVATKFCSEEQYRRRNKEILDKYDVDEKYMVEFDRNEIIRAVNNRGVK